MVASSLVSLIFELFKDLFRLTPLISGLIWEIRDITFFLPFGYSWDSSRSDELDFYDDCSLSSLTGESNVLVAAILLRKSDLKLSLLVALSFSIM